MLSPTQQRELVVYRDALNPAELARHIQTIQDRLTGPARDATLTLQASIDKPPPDTARGVKLRDAS